MNWTLLDELARGIAADLVYDTLKDVACEAGLTEPTLQLMLDRTDRSIEAMQRLRNTLADRR